MTENHKVNLFIQMKYPNFGILQYSVFFDHVDWRFIIWIVPDMLYQIQKTLI